MKKVMKKVAIFFYVIVLSAIIVLLYFWLVGLIYKPYKIDKSWVFSKGEISCIKGDEVYIRNYIIDSLRNVIGSNEDYMGIGFCNPILGEVFTTIYNPKDPEHFFTLDWRPTFFYNENRSLTLGTLITVYKNSSVVFEYSVKGKKYKKCQLLRSRKDYEESKNKIEYLSDNPDLSVISNLKEGQNFEVEYLIENPMRSVIHLDKPL
jgi:hypothetical protein